MRSICQESIFLKGDWGKQLDAFFFFFPLLKNMLLFSRGCGLKILGMEAGANYMDDALASRMLGISPLFSKGLSLSHGHFAAGCVSARSGG